MNREKDAELCKRFPLLYKDRRGRAQDTCMCWGFSVGDGWIGIIERLSEKLEPMIKKTMEEHPGEEYYPTAM